MCTVREGEIIDRIDAFCRVKNFNFSIILLSSEEESSENAHLPCSFTNDAITERVANTIEVETGHNRNVAVAERTQRMLAATRREQDAKK